MIKIAQCPELCIYHDSSSGRLAAVVPSTARSGPSLTKFNPGPGAVNLIGAALGSLGRLYSSGGTSLFAIDERATQQFLPTSYAAVLWFDAHLPAYLWLEGDTLPPPTLAPEEELGDARQWKHCSPLQWDAHAGALLMGLAALEVLPELRGRYRHPVWGEGAPGVFTAPVPYLPQDSSYTHLRTLFECLPLDPLSHARAYMYLLGACHSVSLTEPVPLLCIDSWVQARGKTELAASIAILLDGESSPLSYSDETDTMVSHLVRGRRCVVYDNLELNRGLRNAWLASLVTDRTTAERPKYSRSSVSFLGSLVLMTGITGCYALSRDFVSRAWRVELTGWHAHAFKFRSSVYAREHRAAILTEIMVALRDAPKWEGPAPSSFRGAEFEAIAAATYCHVFGLAPDDLRAIMARHEGHIKGLTPDAISHWLHSHPEKQLHTTFQGRASRAVSELEGSELWGETLKKVGERYVWKA